jgi:hypothetical protein
VAELYTDKDEQAIAILFELQTGCSDPRLLEEVGDLGAYEHLGLLYPLPINQSNLLGLKIVYLDFPPKYCRVIAQQFHSVVGYSQRISGGTIPNLNWNRLGR